MCLAGYRGLHGSSSAVGAGICTEVSRRNIDCNQGKEISKEARAQIKFLANFLAGRPIVEARTSRDICAKGLAEEKAKSPYKILRKEFCVFKGPALNNSCRKCGAQIPLLAELLYGVGAIQN